MWALPGLSGLSAVRPDQALTNDFLAFEKTVENILVVVMVAVVVAGPLFGMFALKIRELKEIIEKEDVSGRHVANTGVVLVAIIPAVMFCLLTAPRLSLAAHRDQADLGLLIGFLAVVAAGIALPVADWRRRRMLSRDSYCDDDDNDDDEGSDPEEKSTNTDEIESPAKGKSEKHLELAAILGE
jgi:hypothetical protein